ncbi:hypothetical protein SCATT_55470 [Streptantibioticus cattleyicolor NRRL 8057 = DSM 46488]|uniref:Uncharacterized protein n=1 Tax=Streptantibioticus cattleyicolor (strain ATCC 35852 / DSM 46488 / JCM 4925 / NBRC 14057 / NRRL 8057) TaxID=1003195 RepID=G8X150_STREN|nr:hypothetical protein SCATT_55470 [Streptantibioticus cattleyicolor NRRL 8057 = DSM 46488]
MRGHRRGEHGEGAVELFQQRDGVVAQRSGVGVGQREPVAGAGDCVPDERVLGGPVAVDDRPAGAGALCDCGEGERGVSAFHQLVPRGVEQRRLQFRAVPAALGAGIRTCKMHECILRSSSSPRHAAGAHLACRGIPLIPAHLAIS